jgi:hypothetical protein
MAGKPGPKPVPGDDHRCVATRLMEDGARRRCKRPKMAGLSVCYNHGGATKASRRKHERAKVLEAMRAFVAPITKDDPEAHPLTAFEVEFRRTIGRIRWLDEELAQVARDELLWGLTKSEKIGAAEFTGRNETYEARANVLLSEQWKERTHLLAMQRIWIGARLDERKLDIQHAYVKALDQAIQTILSSLGHNTSDPAVRQVVRDALLALPTDDARETAGAGSVT